MGAPARVAAKSRPRGAGAGRPCRRGADVRKALRAATRTDRGEKRRRGAIGRMSRKHKTATTETSDAGITETADAGVGEVLGLYQEIAGAVSGAGLAEAIARVLDRVCSFAGWPVGYGLVVSTSHFCPSPSALCFPPSAFRLLPTAFELIWTALRWSGRILRSMAETMTQKPMGGRRRPQGTQEARRDGTSPHSPART